MTRLTGLLSPSDALSFSRADSEVLYRTREGDVVKLDVDTKATTVVVPNQLFVSLIILNRVLCLFSSTQSLTNTVGFFSVFRTELGPQSTKSLQICDMCFLHSM